MVPDLGGGLGKYGQVEKVDSEQGFRFHNSNFLFFGVRKFFKHDLLIACILCDILSFKDHKIPKN